MTLKVALFTLASAALVQVAAAQPGGVEPVVTQAPATTAPGTTAPQNTAWSDVSHINGTPIKVGEKAEYLKANKKYMIGVDPAGLLYGMYGASGWLTLSNNFALKGDLTIFKIIDESGDGVGVAVSTPLYLKRVYQGFFIEPGLMYRKVDDLEEKGLELLMGWQRTWDSGFSIAAAVGPVRLFGVKEDEFADSEPISVNGYLRVAYGF